ncbi:MAG: hypothetical protein WB297_08515, partial [Actinomycetota bacterium]
MTEYRSVLERAGSNAPPPDLQLERVLRRRDRKRRNQRIAAGVVGIAVFVAAVWIVTGVGSLDRSQAPAVPGGAATATPTPTASASLAAAGPFVSEHYGYTIQMPKGWSGAQATQTWDGQGAPAFDSPFVDQLDVPVGGAWGYAASTNLTLTDYTRRTEHAVATEHLCPTKPERDTAIRIDGTPARFLLMHCSWNASPATDGILVLLG